MTRTSAVELPHQLAHEPSTCRIIELFSQDEPTTGPKARIILAKSPETSPSHQSCSTACRYLLQQLLSFTSVTNENDWELHHSTSGAPFLSNNGKPSTLNISLAHSANWLAAGVASEAQIGVDIEQFRSRRNILQIANYLGWKEQARDIWDFHAKWTLWEASAKCVTGSVMMVENPGFEQLCSANTRDQVCTSGRWNGLHGCFDKKLFYTIVLKGQHESTLTHRIPKPGKTEPW